MFSIKYSHFCMSNFVACCGLVCYLANTLIQSEGAGMKRRDIQEVDEKALFEAVLKLENVEECRKFFYDLCTPSEVEEFSDRWKVACLLVKEKPYRQISEETGVSTTTVGRVARFLHHGHHGYKTVLERLGCLEV